MRVSKIYESINKPTGYNVIQRYPDKEEDWLVEEYEGELEKSWFVRELPSLIMLILICSYVFKAFGFGIFLCIGGFGLGLFIFAILLVLFRFRICKWQ